MSETTCFLVGHVKTIGLLSTSLPCQESYDTAKMSVYNCEEKQDDAALFQTAMKSKANSAPNVQMLKRNTRRQSNQHLFLATSTFLQLQLHDGTWCNIVEA